MTAAVELAARYTTPDTTVEIGTTCATVEWENLNHYTDRLLGVQPGTAVNRDRVCNTPTVTVSCRKYATDLFI